MTGRRRFEVPSQGLCFGVGRHLLRLAKCPEGWTASIDGLCLGGHFPNQAEAWQAGVRAAFSLDAPAPKSVILEGPSPGQPGDSGPGEASDASNASGALEASGR